MTKEITAAFISGIDAEFIDQDLPMHARPMAAGFEWLRRNNIASYYDLEGLMKRVSDLYKFEYPNADFNMPDMLVGCVSFRGQIYEARVMLAFGSVSIDPIRSIVIDPKELELIWNTRKEEYWRAFYSVADLWDFAYGLDDLGKLGGEKDLFFLARSQIVSTARTLRGNNDLDAATQSACLSVELAMKGLLANCGWSENKMRKLGHRLEDLADAVIQEKPNMNDDVFKNACSNFPHYVQSRYSHQGLTQNDLGKLAMRAQFVASECTRRLTDRDMANQLATDQQTPARPII